jgi:anti-sigma B factor antagonist
MSLQMSTRRVGEDVIVVTLSGALSFGTDLKIADTQIQQLIEDGASKVVLDLSGVPYSDSAGLGTLVHINGLVQERHGILRLCGLSDRVAALLKMTKMDSVLAMDGDADASLMFIQCDDPVVRFRMKPTNK